MAWEQAETCWFLTREGWVELDDKTAIEDREMWPAGTLVAGLLGSQWQERWRDHWMDDVELRAILTQYGEAPHLTAVK